MTALELSFGPVSERAPRVAVLEVFSRVWCAAVEVEHGSWTARVLADESDAATIMADGQPLRESIARIVFENVSWCRGWPYIFDAQRGAKEEK